MLSPMKIQEKIIIKLPIDSAKNAFEFLRELEAKLNTIPEEYRNTSTIVFNDVSPDEDWCEDEVSIFWERDETEEEVLKRESQLPISDDDIKQSMLNKLGIIIK